MIDGLCEGVFGKAGMVDAFIYDTPLLNLNVLFAHETLNACMS